MEVLNTLGINPQVVLIQIIIFIAFYFILKKFLFTPILKIIHLKGAIVDEKNKEIENVKKKVEALEQKINMLIAESDKEVLAVEEAKLKEVLNRKNQMISQLHTELLNSIQKLRDNFEDEKKKIIEQLENILVPIKQDVLLKILKNGSKQ